MKLLAYAGGVLAVIAALYGIFRAVDSRAYARGVDETAATWQAREAVQLASANAKILELADKYRALEKKSADDVADATRRYAEDMTRLENERDKALAAAAAGSAFRLRWKPARAAACPPGDRSPAAEPRPAAPEPAETAACELPAATRDDLIRLASDADAVTAERNQAVEIASKDREVCK